ncbi:hypothetical protein ACWGDT_32500 [Streptomyces avermitilis]
MAVGEAGDADARAQVQFAAADRGGDQRVTLQTSQVVGLRVCRGRPFKAANDRSTGYTLFYAWLKELGTLPAEAPSSLRYLANTSGQVSMEQLIDRFGIRCRPIRDLLVDYLKERQPGLDYTSLNNLSRHLASNFWGDLEQPHPGIDSLHLAPEVSAAWKQRCRTRIERRRQPDGTVREVVTARVNIASIMISVLAFYLDIAQWAIDEPARWGSWAVPSPIKDADVAVVKDNKRRKARMDHRTRERLPALPGVARAASASTARIPSGCGSSSRA